MHLHQALLSALGHVYHNLAGDYPKPIKIRQPYSNVQRLVQQKKTPDPLSRIGRYDRGPFTCRDWAEWAGGTDAAASCKPAAWASDLSSGPETGEGAAVPRGPEARTLPSGTQYRVASS